MNTKAEILSTPISELNVESDDNKIRLIEDSELTFVAGGALGTLGFNWVESVLPTADA